MSVIPTLLKVSLKSENGGDRASIRLKTFLLKSISLHRLKQSSYGDRPSLTSLTQNQNA